MPNYRTNSLEQYYTIPEVANSCVEFMISKVGQDHRWIEPTAGCGSFLDALETHGILTYQAFDIDPKDPRIKKQDFLEFNSTKFDHVFVGNPPFGRACSLAIKIFNHCAKFGKIIGFIVPKSFNKISIQDQLNLNFRLRWKFDCPSLSFQDHEKTHFTGGVLQTEFQIWELDLAHPRDKRQGYRSKTFSFVKKDDSYDVAFRTHGSGCGKVLPAGDYNPRTTAFLKVDDNRAYAALENANFVQYSTQVSYIPCLSPAEISLCVDEWLNLHDDLNNKESIV